MDRPPHGRLAEPLAVLLGPPGIVLHHRRIWRGLQPRAQQGVLLRSNAAWAAWNRFRLQRARRALLHDRAFHGRHRDSKSASGFSHGLTVGHRSHQAFFQVGRIGAHIRCHRISHACLRFLQVALNLAQIDGLVSSAAPLLVGQARSLARFGVRACWIALELTRCGRHLYTWE